MINSFRKVITLAKNEGVHKSDGDGIQYKGITIIWLVQNTTVMPNIKSKCSLPQIGHNYYTMNCKVFVFSNLKCDLKLNDECISIIYLTG